jgi:predicted TIM-barrel fold metal-dependent hydrolase
VIADTHLHPLSPDQTKYPRLAASRFQGVSSAEDIIVRLRHGGVDRAVAVQFFGVYGEDNSYVADSVNGHPEVFAGVGCVDPLAPDAAEALASWTQRGVRGLRLFTPRERPDLARWPDEAAAYPLYDAAVALGTPICLSLQPSALVHAGTLAARFPRLTLVLDHLGNVPIEPSSAETQALLVLAVHPNLLLKYSTQNFATVDHASVLPGFMRTLADAFGTERLMWGSNFPVNRGTSDPYGELVERGFAAVSGFVASDVDAMMGDNAARVFFV